MVARRHPRGQPDDGFLIRQDPIIYCVLDVKQQEHLEARESDHRSDSAFLAFVQQDHVVFPVISINVCIEHDCDLVPLFEPVFACLLLGELQKLLRMRQRCVFTDLLAIHRFDKMRLLLLVEQGEQCVEVVVLGILPFADYVYDVVGVNSLEAVPVSAEPSGSVMQWSHGHTTINRAPRNRASGQVRHHSAPSDTPSRSTCRSSP